MTNLEQIELMNLIKQLLLTSFFSKEEKTTFAKFGQLIAQQMTNLN